jgi:transposase
MDRDEAGAISILAKALRELSRGGQSQTSSLELVNANGHINLCHPPFIPPIRGDRGGSDKLGD